MDNPWIEYSTVGLIGREQSLNRIQHTQNIVRKQAILTISPLIMPQAYRLPDRCIEVTSALSPFWQG